MALPTDPKAKMFPHVGADRPMARSRNVYCAPCARQGSERSAPAMMRRCSGVRLGTPSESSMFANRRRAKKRPRVPGVDPRSRPMGTRCNEGAAPEEWRARPRFQRERRRCAVDEGQEPATGADHSRAPLRAPSTWSAVPSSSARARSKRTPDSGAKSAGSPMDTRGNARARITDRHVQRVTRSVACRTGNNE